jgi:hypothetical protein
MPIRATIKLNLPAALWTAQQSAALASNVVASIKMRTSEGLDTNDKPFKPYSKKPIYIAMKGARLKPKGGRVSRTVVITSTRPRAASMAQGRARSLTWWQAGS